MNNSNPKKRSIFSMQKCFVVPKSKVQKTLSLRTEKTPSKAVSDSKNNQTELNFNYLYESEHFLSQDQKTIVDAIFKERKNILFTGSAGTGKSFLLRHIINVFNRIQEEESSKPTSGGFGLSPENLAITASTGLAAFNIKGTTIHSFGGIGTGEQNLSSLIKKVKINKKALSRWQDTKFLIIDEVSMMSDDLFDKLDSIAKLVRKNNRPFGGIQIILAGDFFQLPPVSKSHVPIKFCFESSKWKQCVEKTFNLSCIYRQKDKNLAAHLNNLRIGNVPDDTVKFFQSLARPISQGNEIIEPTELYSTRFEVDKANKLKLGRLSGRELVYEARDWCKAELDKTKLESCLMAPKTLNLKINAQVMLIKNMTSIHHNLVNGAIGVVIGFCFLNEKESEKKNVGAGFYKGSYPKVRFLDGHEQIISPEVWEIENNGLVVASRMQFPLVLAWALSIHKSQGQTLPLLKVDLGRVFEKGQTYVALSRAPTSEGLQVLNFDKNKIRCHEKVVEFYRQINEN